LPTRCLFWSLKRCKSQDPYWQLDLLLVGAYEPLPFSADLAPSDFHVCGSVQNYLADKQFAADTDMKQAVISWLQTLSTISSTPGCYPWWANV
jgi:hypothetical protein